MTVAIAIVGIVDGCVRRRIHRWSPTTIEKHGGACARAPDQCCIEIPRCGRGGDACLFSLAYSRLSLACPIQTTGLTSPLKSELSLAGRPSSASGCKPRPLESSDQMNSLRLRATFWDGQR